MRLKYQLFITLLIASALLVALMFLVSSLSFSRGFLGYINDTATERLQPLVAALESQYATDGSWNRLTSNPELWHHLVANETDYRGRRHKRPQDKRGNNKRPPPPNQFIQRIVLANSTKQTLLGRTNANDKLTWTPITQQNNVVGYLGFNTLKRLNNQFDQAFERQQKKGFAIAGLSMVLLSALLAAPLAARIVKPILNVKGTVAEISQGNYSHRVETTRQDEIGDLAADINKLGATLEENKEARQRLIAEISHELRTPVAVLRGELEALQDGVREVNNDSIDSLHAETIKLNRLIDDLHTLSLANVGGLDYQMGPVNLTTVVDKQIANYQSIEPDLNISVNTHGNTHTLNADKQRIEQLIDNLMQNSIRYTDKPGSITVLIENNNANNAVNLVWSDSAPGVGTDSLEKLFDPLFREEKSRSREHGGAGLGLSIVKKIANAHNGTCSAAHSDMGGLRISISFPTLRGIHS